jgi:hypothetical protein
MLVNVLEGKINHYGVIRQNSGNKMHRAFEKRMNFRQRFQRAYNSWDVFKDPLPNCSHFPIREKVLGKGDNTVRG